MSTKVEKALELHGKGSEGTTVLEILKMENLLKQIPIRKQKNLQKNSAKRTEPIIVVT